MVVWVSGAAPDVSNFQNSRIAVFLNPVKFNLPFFPTNLPKVNYRRGGF
jgi:hypothetical protein